MVTGPVQIAPSQHVQVRCSGGAASAPPKCEAEHKPESGSSQLTLEGAEAEIPPLARSRTQAHSASRSRLIFFPFLFARPPPSDSTYRLFSFVLLLRLLLFERRAARRTGSVI